MRLKRARSNRDSADQPVADSGSSGDLVFLPGTLVVDWLDEEALEDVAEQLDLRSAVESRLMAVEGTTRKVGLAAQVISAETALADESTHESKFGRAAAGVRLRAVLNKLVAQNELADFLFGAYGFSTEPPDFSLRDREVRLEAMSALVVHDDSPMEERLEAEMALRMALGRRSYSAARLRDWFLLEGHWAVQRNEECTLSFVGVSPAGKLKETGELFSVVVGLPGGSSSDGWRLPGARLQHGDIVKATVFGAVDDYDDHDRLAVSAIAIFDRKAGDPGFVWGAYLGPPPGE
jgi:hypothetical protein